MQKLTVEKLKVSKLKAGRSMTTFQLSNFLTFQLCISILFSISSFSQTKLSSEITSLQSDTDLTHASWSICVKDVKKDSVIEAYNSYASLTPASTLKIITTSTSLFLLGWDYKYETYLEYDGKLDTISGILDGNLYIKGSGDPTLASEVFRKKSDTIPLTDQWADILVKKKIKKITGSIIADATALEDDMIPPTWIWGDMGNYYGAGASGLTFMDNKFTLYFKTGSKKGDSTFITKIVPEVPGMILKNKVITSGYSDNAYIYGAPYDELRTVKGTIPANRKDYEVEGTTPDPPLFLAQMLDSSLVHKGVNIGKQAQTLRTSPQTDPKKRNRVYTQTSHTLDKIVYQTNILSDNLYAETLLKTLGLKKGKSGDDQTGMDIVYNFWKAKGVDLKGFYMADGCGLSRWNAVSTFQMTSILNTITKDTLVYRKFYESLPIAGKSGSLGKLCKGTSAENNIRAKSGYMTRVRSYAGYCTSKKGRLLSFSIIANNYDCSPGQMKDKLEKLMIAIAELE